MICRRFCKCEPLLRFNPLNLAKIVCFDKWVKGAKCVSSDFLNEKVLMILTCIILKIKAQLNQLVNWKLQVALFYRSNRLNFDKICIFHKHLRSSCGTERKFVKKNLQKRISPIQFHISYILIKRSLQKNYERNSFCGQNSIGGSYRDWLLNITAKYPVCSIGFR